MKKRKLLLGLLAGLLCVSCTACGSSLAENTETYFSTTSAILKTLFASGQTDKPAATPARTATPSSWTPPPTSP